jgi:hypothetical protein
MKKNYFLSMIGIISLMLLTGSYTVLAQETCEKYGVVEVSGGEYKLQNCVWGADTSQCIQSTGGTGFTVSVSEHNQGSVAAYPSIFKGCHWGDCTSNSGMPRRVSEAGSANFSFSVSSSRPSGDYNVAAECWLSPNSDSSNGYSGGAEIMIVLDVQNMGWSGSQVGTFNGHDVYFADVDWNFVQYIRTGRSSASGNMMDFINDAISRGYVDPSWYIHDMEAGFEIMRGGQGLTCNSFSFSVGGGGGTTTTTSTAGTTTTTSTAATTTTSTGTGNCDCGTCNWYGTNVPLCCNTSSGWGWSDGGCNRTCISQSTCDSQPGGGGGTTTTTSTQATTTTTSTGATTTTTTTSAGTTTTTSTSGGGGGSTCSPVDASISPGFTQNGAGTFCWTASSCSYINSWNMETLTVNGQDFTNKWAGGSSLPAKIDGKWYIYYKGNYGWSHFELR